MIYFFLNNTIDNYEIDFRADRKGNLGSLDFQGATKRSRPNLNLKSIVFCKVKEVPEFCDYKLTCLSAKNKKEWSTGEATYRELKGDIFILISLIIAFYYNKYMGLYFV